MRENVSLIGCKEQVITEFDFMNSVQNYKVFCKISVSDTTGSSKVRKKQMAETDDFNKYWESVLLSLKELKNPNLSIKVDIVLKFNGDKEVLFPRIGTGNSLLRDLQFGLSVNDPDDACEDGDSWLMVKSDHNDISSGIRVKPVIITDEESGNPVLEILYRYYSHFWDCLQIKKNYDQICKYYESYKWDLDMGCFSGHSLILVINENQCLMSTYRAGKQSGAFLIRCTEKDLLSTVRKGCPKQEDVEAIVIANSFVDNKKVTIRSQNYYLIFSIFACSDYQFNRPSERMNASDFYKAYETYTDSLLN